MGREKETKQAQTEGPDKEAARGLLEKLKEKFKDAKRQKFVFLLIGRTGVGKSSTVNTLMGVQVAPVGDYEPTTFAIEAYESQAYGIHFRIIDTPGLCDDLEEAGNDEAYLNRIMKNVAQLDCMLFVTRLPETRVTSDEKRAIKLVTSALGPEVWEYSVIVFSFANSVSPDRYAEAVEKRTELIRREIAKYTSDSLASEIPSVPIDNLSKHTPDGQEWLGSLYTNVFTRLHDKGLTAFFLATADRLKVQGLESKVSPTSPSTEGSDAHQPPPPPINLNPAQARILKKRIDGSIVGGMTITGAAIGAVFGPAGAAIGGAIGAAIGLIAWLSD
ncbi:MAG TPA: GTPase [Thermoanaerobaculia bacterium]|nr:GTPase [Thermoanaerobaculia bacterium]